MTDESSVYKLPEIACMWPANEAFTMRDEPGEHDPCYLIMPGGAMIPFAHHATNGVDQARCKFIMDACNAALFGCDLDLTVLAEVIRDAYNRFADMDYFPSRQMAEAVERSVAYRVRETSWQPIETAPQDGTRFLAWAEMTADELDEDDRVIERNKVTRYQVVAYYLFGGIVEFPLRGRYLPNVQYTHWMPLPEGPK